MYYTRTLTADLPRRPAPMASRHAHRILRAWARFYWRGGHHPDVAAGMAIAAAIAAGVPAGFCLRHAAGVPRTLGRAWEPVPGSYLRSEALPLGS